MLNINDNPHRVAPPYCAPGEIDPGDHVEITAEVACNEIMNAIWADGTAYGLCADELFDEMIDQIVGGNPAEMRDLIQSCMALPRVRERCRQLANGD